MQAASESFSWPTRVRGSGWRIRTWDAVKKRRDRKNSAGVPYFCPHVSGIEQQQHFWLSVPTPFKSDTKKFLQGKITKASREVQSQATSHDLRCASWAAYRCGAISTHTREADDALNKLANQGKHQTSRSQLSWAQRLICSSSTSSRKPWADTFDDDVVQDDQSGGVASLDDFVASTAKHGASSAPVGDTAVEFKKGFECTHLGDDAVEEPATSCFDSGDLDLEQSMPTDQEPNFTRGALEIHVEHPQRNDEYWTTQVAALRFENGQLFEQVTTLRQELGLARSQIHNAEVALQAWMHHASCLECQSFPSRFGGISDCNKFSCDGIGSSEDCIGSTPLVLLSALDENLATDRDLVGVTSKDEELNKAACDQLQCESGSTEFKARIERLESICDQFQSGSDSEELKSRIEEQMVVLEQRMDRSFRWQRAEDEIALQEQQRFDDALAALTKRVAGLETSGRERRCEFLEAARHDLQLEWRAYLDGIRTTFQGRLDDLPNVVHREIDRHLFDSRLLELSKKLQACHSQLHVLDSKLQEAVCDPFQSGSGSELLLRMQRLEGQVDQLQSGSDSAELKRIDGNGGNEIVVAEPQQRSVAELQAIFERLQTCPPSKAHHAASSSPTLVPLVDMGIYVSNSTHIETPHSDGLDNSLCTADAHVEPQRDEATTFKQRRFLVHQQAFNESSDSDSESRLIAQQFVDAGYNPENEIESDDQFEDEKDAEMYELYRRHHVPSNEPWT